MCVCVCVCEKVCLCVCFISSKCTKDPPKCMRCSAFDGLSICATRCSRLQLLSHSNGARGELPSLQDRWSQKLSFLFYIKMEKMVGMFNLWFAASRLEI